MNGPYNIQYRKSSLERHRLMEKLKVMLVLAMMLGFSVLVFSGFSSPAPARPFEDVPLQSASSFQGGATPAWLREYRHAHIEIDASESGIRQDAAMVVKPVEQDASSDAGIRRITPIEADRRQLERALRIAGE